MTELFQDSISRRSLLQTSGRIAASATLAGVAVPQLVFAGVDSTVQLALIGCGGRGTGAAANALSTKNGPVKLVSMCDVFEERLKGAADNLSGQFKEKFDVPQERRFLGFDGYKRAMDALKPGDVVILTTPVAFRWPMFRYAIDKGLNVFMEKPTTVDGPSTRKMLALAEESERKGLKVGVGLMCRHCEARGQLFDRIKNGEIGDLVLLRAYRQAGPTGNAFVAPKPAGIGELAYQIKNFHGFLWASGGGFSDFLIHNIDECCWMKDAWPVMAKGSGGRHFRGDYVDQNFDSYSVEYTYADGSKLYLEGRTMPGCDQEFASFAHGSKGSAVISQAGHAPSRARIYKSQNMKNKDDIVWQYGPNEPNPYQLEWDHLMDAIRNNKPFNEAKRGAMASLVTAMGRFACHTGQKMTLDEMLEHEHELAPNVDQLSFDGPAPILADANGKYALPQPGINKTREF